MGRSAATGVHDDPADPDWVTGPDGVLVGAPNDERAAVGLPIDPDGDPDTPHRWAYRPGNGYGHSTINDQR